MSLRANKKKEKGQKDSFILDEHIEGRTENSRRESEKPVETGYTKEIFSTFFEEDSSFNRPYNMESTVRTVIK
jgi:hypothetical protein